MSSTNVYPQLGSDELNGLTALVPGGETASPQDGDRALAAHELAQVIDAEAQRYASLAGRLKAVLRADEALQRSGWVCSRSRRSRHRTP